MSLIHSQRLPVLHGVVWPESNHQQAHGSGGGKLATLVPAHIMIKSDSRSAPGPQLSDPSTTDRKARQTGVMATWVGLIGVLAGALIAFVSQYLVGRSERQERNEALLLEQCALLIALSEDYRNRVWEERHQVAAM